MPNTPFPRDPEHLKQKKVRLLLLGGQVLEGSVHIPDGQSMLHFLRMKRHFLNLTAVRRPGPPEDEEALPHLSLRLSMLVWIIPLDDTLHVSTGSVPPGASRLVELQLVDEVTLKVTLNISEEQRMSDYLDGNTGFLPLWSAEVEETGELVERLAVNHEAILAIRELPS
jgi:hypothetical protein